jgi:hypothetical protein
MFPFLLGGAALLALFALGSSEGSSGGSSGASTYVDRNGVAWKIWEEPGAGQMSASGTPMGEMWTVSTDGYGGRWSGTGVTGYVSYKQAVENIEGNAASRDPKTGNITQAAAG